MAAFQFPDPAVLQTVTNTITGSTYQWQESSGKWVITRKTAAIGDIIWEGDLPPDPIGDYKLWYNTDELELNFYYCDANGVCAWVPTSVPIQVLEDLNVFVAEAEVDINQLKYRQTLQQNLLDELYVAHQQDNYVKKEGGDSMEGPLVIQAQDPTDARATKKVQTLGVFSNSDSSALRLGTTRDRVYVGHDDVSINGPVKVGEIQEKSNGNGIKVSNTLTMSDNKLTGLPEAVDDTDAVPLVQLLDNVSILQNEIVELEEEIDAIAPSVERGQFISTTYSNAPRDGEFMLLTLAGKTLDYGDPDIAIVQLSKVDNEGVAHTYADVEDGQLLQLFEDGKPDYGLYLIEGVAGNDDPSQTAVTFTVSPVSGFGEATEGDLARLKIFKAPEGGTADGFVLKTGDTMTGTLTLSNTYALNLKGKIQINGSTTSSRFLGTNSSGDMEWRTALTSQTKSDWNQSSTGNAAYIYNKPTVVTGSKAGIKISSTNGNYYIEG